MDGDRKYRQHGYQDGGSGNPNNGNAPKERYQPRHPMDITAPRLPRMVQNVTASRCAACSATLPAGFDFLQPCPKCAADLHCCRQCEHFEPSTRFQCLKPIEERIPYKDKRNECALFTPRVTVARESTQASTPAPRTSPLPGNGSAPSPQRNGSSRSSDDARSAFEKLFKK